MLEKSLGIKVSGATIVSQINVVVDRARSEDELNLIPGNAAGTAAPVCIPLCCETACPMRRENKISIAQPLWSFWKPGLYFRRPVW